MQQFSKEGEKVWLLRLLVKGIVTNWPNQRFIHVWDQMYVSPSQLSPSALVTPTNIAGTAFWQRGTKSASFTLEQPQTPWISRGVFFSERKGAGPLAVGHRPCSITVCHSFSVLSAAIQLVPWAGWLCKPSICSSCHTADVTQYCESCPTRASSNLVFLRLLFELI